MRFIKTNNIGMLNKKLSDLFMRKENKKEEPKKVDSFDESYFSCRIDSNGLNTDLIKIQTEIKQTGMPLDEIKCKWYIKNSRDFKQIEQVASSYYQPCLDDVGSIICVQIEPFIEGKKYDGITLMEETEIIEIDNELESRLENFLQQRSISFDSRVEAIYSQNEKFQHIELPLEVKVEVSKDRIIFKAGDIVIENIIITQEFPLIEFIRKTFNSLLFNYNDKESMKLSLANNFDRDLFALIVRTCAAHSHSQTQGINPEMEVECSKEEKTTTEEYQSEEKQVKGSDSLSQDAKSDSVSPVVSSVESLEAIPKSPKEVQIQKREEGKNKSTLFILKLDEVNKELKTLKRKYQLLQENYRLQKQGKCQAETELQSLKKQFESMRKERDEALLIARKVRQLKQDNRFYKNEIFITKKEWKEEKEKRSSLERNIQKLTSQQSQQMQTALLTLHQGCQNMKHAKQESDRKRDEAESQMQKLKQEVQRFQNENHMLKKKLQSLAHEKGLDRMVDVRSRKPSKANDSEFKIKELEMKIKSLEMLVKYKSSHGDSNTGFQLLVNNLTETIAEKELEIDEIKKINKNLLLQLNEAKQKTK